jgi:hypothetical protein
MKGIIFSRRERGSLLHLFGSQRVARLRATVLESVLSGAPGMSYRSVVIALQRRWCNFCKNSFDSASGCPLSLEKDAVLSKGLSGQ